LHGIEKPDDVAKRIAEVEGIPLAITNIKLDMLLAELKRKYS